MEENPVSSCFLGFLPRLVDGPAEDTQSAAEIPSELSSAVEKLEKWLDSEAGNPCLFHRHGLRRGQEMGADSTVLVFWDLSRGSRARLAAGFCIVLANIFEPQLQEESTQSDEEAL